MNRSFLKKLFSTALCILLLVSFAGCAEIIIDTPDPVETTVTASQNAEQTTAASSESAQKTETSVETQASGEFDLNAIPAYGDSPYVALNGNNPLFTDEEVTTDAYEYYPSLDALGRCGACMACLEVGLMPTEERGDISSVHPSGWIQASYDFVDGNNLYNRCHLIGFQLAGENANARNLITGTRYMNVTGMLPFENMVADYLKETGYHVMYRVTPLYQADELVARGVVMEAWSVEDQGDGICFCVFCYNVQPGVEIDYATGESSALTADNTDDVGTYVLNTSSHKFHLPDCSSVSAMNEKNRQDYTGSRALLIAQGYEPCGSCNP